MLAKFIRRGITGKLLTILHRLFFHSTNNISQAIRNRLTWYSVAAKTSSTTKIGWNVTFLNSNIKIGDKTCIEDYVCLEPEAHGDHETLVIGENCWIRSYARIHCWRGSVEIGDDCSLNAYSVIYGTGGVKIGKGVRIAAHTIVVASTHIYQRLDIPIYKQGWDAKGISIEDGVWIGCNVSVLDGVTIGHDSIIAAGAVVIDDIPPFCVAGGIPAKILKKRTEIE